MKQAIIDLLSQKKAIAMITTGIIAAIARLGFDADPEFVAMIVAAGVAYVGSQGIADHGKEAAKIEAAKPQPFSSLAIKGELLETSQPTAPEKPAGVP